MILSYETLKAGLQPTNAASSITETYTSNVAMLICIMLFLSKL